MDNMNNMDNMNEKVIEETPIWELFQKSVNFLTTKGFYTDIDRNENFFNDNQWEDLLIDGVEPVQYNFIKRIVNHKVYKVLENSRAINYSAENFDNTEFRLQVKKVCDLFNVRAARCWENNKMSKKLKSCLKTAAINTEAIIYSVYDEDINDPKVEKLSKADVYYANENDSEIQKQPYILIKKRTTISEIISIAKKYEVSEEEIKNIIGDDDTLYESGSEAKQELNKNCTMITKFYKKDGKIYFSISTKYVDIAKDKEYHGTLYPLAHLLWDEKEGSARGAGEVKPLIPNQIAANRIAVRRLLVSKKISYPQTVYNSDYIENVEDIDVLGASIEVKGLDTTDVSKVLSSTRPMQMGPDAEKIQNELIDRTSDLRDTSDAATGQVNPELASGKAIMALQHAATQPLNDQNESVDSFVEDIALIWLDQWKAFNKNGITLETIEQDPQTGEDVVKTEKVRGVTLEKLKASVKIDITPKGPYDKYAQEISIENLAKSEQFMNTSWLEDYESMLDFDAIMPKLKIQELIKRRKKNKEKILAIQQQMELLQQNVGQLVDSGSIGPRMQQNINQQM